MSAGKISKKGRNPAMVDNWLDNLDLYRKNVAYDETCLFRAVSEQLFHCQIFHERVRRESIHYGREHYSDFQDLVNSIEDWNRHLDMLEKHMVICGNLEINLISKKYQRDVLIFHANQHQIYYATKCGSSSEPLMLCLMDEDHYDAIYRKEQISDAGFCQSIVYKVLYEQVFNIPNVDSIVNAMLYEKSPVISQLELEGTKDNSTINIQGNNLKLEDLSNIVVAPFPFKVAKALDPTIYRNIEYDSWGEVRRELRLGDWYYGDEKLKLGTRCILNDRDAAETLDCYIQELHKDQDKCVVYLTKYAEKRVVKYSDLAPESDAKPWPLPYRFSKSSVVNTTTQLAPMDKVKSMRKKNKERKQLSKSVSDLSNDENVNAYVGMPLQMQSNNNNNNNSNCNKTETVPESVGLTIPTAEGLITPATPDVNSYPQRYQWEQVNWPTTVQYIQPETTFYPQSPDQVMWSQGSPTSFYEYKPMVASAPVTPNVVPYHDTSYPYFLNYHVEQYPQYPLSSNGPQQQLPQQSLEPVQRHLDTSQQVHNESVNCQAQAAPPPGSPPRQSVAYVSHGSQPLEVYPQMVNIQPGTPVVYTTIPPPPEGMEMVMPTSPLGMYTPITPMDVPYVPQPSYIYPTSQNAVPWYPPPSFPYNSQGFIFPPANAQAK